MLAMLGSYQMKAKLSKKIIGKFKNEWLINWFKRLDGNGGKSFKIESTKSYLS